MENEIWKKIEEFPNYEVSNIGRMKSLNYNRSGKEKIMKGGINSNGYVQICLVKNEKQFYRTIHTLVWDAFGNSPRNGSILQVDHIDNDKLNNRIENLQLLNNRENNSKKVYENKSSKYKGVSWDKNALKWKACIRINGKRKHLGYFTNEEAASEAYQTALKNLNKKSPE